MHSEAPPDSAVLVFLHSPDPASPAQALPLPSGFTLGEGVSAALAAGEAGSALPDLEHVSAFRARHFFGLLRTEFLGRRVLAASSLPSTQALLAQNRGLLPEGVLCVAHTQSAGKGRGANTWDSPEGCLLFSTLLTEEDGRKLPMFQYVVALAIVKAVESMCSRRQVPKLPVFIKWPNDIYTKEVKVGGILCNSTYSNKQFSVVAGVGLNVSNLEPTTCLNQLLLLGQGAEGLPPLAPVSREEALAEFCNHFEPMLRTFREEGFAPLERDYIARWLHSGQEVLLSTTTEGAEGGCPVLVTIKGLTPQGYLSAADSSGAEYELSPDGNSFDFFQGLIGRKLQA